MNRFQFQLNATDASHHVGICKLFTLINTIGVNPDFKLNSNNTHIEYVQVDLPFDDPVPELSQRTTKIVDNSEITSSPDLRLFPYVTVGSVVCVLAKDEMPEADMSRFYRYDIEDSSDEIRVYVGIANSALTESYAPFGVREGVKPVNILALTVTSENALQNMLNACSRFPVNPSTGLSARDLMATSL